MVTAAMKLIRRLHLGRKVMTKLDSILKSRYIALPTKVHLVKAMVFPVIMQVRKQQLEVDMEQQTGSKSGKEYVKAVYCHPAYNLYAEYIMRNARLDETQARNKIPGRNINKLRYADDTTLMAECEEELKSLLMKVKEESEKLA